MERISWDQYFMAQSHLLALRSTCTRLMVGATIVRDNRIIAGGYNGSVSGSVHCIDEGCYMIDGHCMRTIHAETNAVLQCAKFGVSTDRADIYVTHFPCLQCSKLLIQSGIKTICYANDYRNSEYAIELFREANVKIRKVEFNDLFIEDKNEEKVDFVTNLLKELEENLNDKPKVKQLRNEAKQLFNCK